LYEQDASEFVSQQEEDADLDGKNNDGRSQSTKKRVETRALSAAPIDEPVVVRGRHDCVLGTRALTFCLECFELWTSVAVGVLDMLM
jgi:hypothetical protein